MITGMDGHLSTIIDTPKGTPGSRISLSDADVWNKVGPVNKDAERSRGRISQSEGWFLEGPINQQRAFEVQVPFRINLEFRMGCLF
jgi:hypothetical protein